jgi:hypothetical protein
MRLTQTHREAFVRAALNDVPTVNYREKIQKLIQEDSINKLDPALRRIARSNTLKMFLATAVTYFDSTSVTIFSDERYGHQYVASSEEVGAELRELAAKQKAQEETLSNLRSKLTAAAKSCSTRKQLAELLPEFEKYLPDEEGKASRSVPAISNMVGDFIRAGWPKDKSQVK